jgi:hypothetical protein
MKVKQFVATAIVVTVVVAAAACGGKSDNSTEQASPVSQTQTQPVTSQPKTMEDILDGHYDETLTLCEAYYSLVNEGWTDDNIYKQLQNSGAFDGYNGAESEFFHTMIRWCYKNN